MSSAVRFAAMMPAMRATAMTSPLRVVPDLIAFTIRGTFQMAGIESVAPPPPTNIKKGGKRG